MPRIPNGPPFPGVPGTMGSCGPCRPNHNPINASDDAKLQVMAAKLLDQFKKDTKTINNAPLTISELDQTKNIVLPTAISLNGTIYAPEGANPTESDTIVLPNLVTDEALAEELSKKANDIPFTKDVAVGADIGGFKTGDNVRGMTVAEILSKLLQLTILPPDTLEEMITELIETQAPIYQIDNNGRLSEVPFNFFTMTEEEAKLEPTTAGFYLIKNNQGEIIEVGIQQLCSINPKQYYMIALPSYIRLSRAEVQCYNKLPMPGIEAGWQAYSGLNVTNNSGEIAAAFINAGKMVPIIPRTGYSLWISTNSGNNGASIRFILNNIYN